MNRPPEVWEQPNCACGHRSSAHEGTDRSGSPIRRTSTRCRMCLFCDYYKLAPYQAAVTP